MWDLISLALHDHDPLPEKTWEELIESRCNVELDGKRVDFFA